MRQPLMLNVSVDLAADQRSGRMITPVSEVSVSLVTITSSASK